MSMPFTNIRELVTMLGTQFAAAENPAQPNNIVRSLGTVAARFGSLSPEFCQLFIDQFNSNPAHRKDYENLS